MNHWLECILNWHGGSLGQGDSSLCKKTKKIPGVINSPAPGGHSFIKVYITKDWKNFFS